VRRRARRCRRQSQEDQISPRWAPPKPFAVRNVTWLGAGLRVCSRRACAGAPEASDRCSHHRSYGFCPCPARAECSAPRNRQHRRFVPHTDAGNSARCRMFLAPFTSRSCHTPHGAHIQNLTRNPLTFCAPLSDPQDEQLPAGVSRADDLNASTRLLALVKWPAF
jgi:hypothetical protein